MHFYKLTWLQADCRAPLVVLTRLCVLRSTVPATSVYPMHNTVAFYQVRMLNSTHNCAPLDPGPCVELLLGVDRQGVKEKDRRTPPAPTAPQKPGALRSAPGLCAELLLGSLVCVSVCMARRSRARSARCAQC